MVKVYVTKNVVDFSNKLKLGEFITKRSTLQKCSEVIRQKEQNIEYRCVFLKRNDDQ